ncbi:hypothetical protein [Roseiflexus sp.]|uniref:hypothetical protein n=1 Tax=Roseiflexus sp. TaxID=2562120 RepID=UPI0025F648E6|nr:hypothetical protein [Roseiflexus sp.]
MERLRVSRFLPFLGDDWDDAGASAAQQASVTDREQVSCAVSTTRRRTHRHCTSGRGMPRPDGSASAWHRRNLAPERS